METVNQLIEKYMSVYESPANQANKAYWENSDEPYLVERWRGRSLRRENTPFTMAMDISGYSPVLGFNCADYYSNAEQNLIQQLRYALWEAEHLDCMRYFENTVFCSIGSVFEASFFGAKIDYLPGQAPWYDEKVPVFEDKADLLKLKPFSFENSGLAPKVTEFYEHHKAAVEPFGMKSMFPVTMRGPFSIAIMLRGFENLLIDMLTDEDFFADLMDSVTTYLLDYSAARAKYLGEDEPTAFLMNDEISTPMVSGGMYMEKIFPYEQKIAGRCKGVRYWHSCGVTHDYYEHIAKLPGLKMMHVGPWSDVGKAAEVFGEKDIAIEICLNSTRDMYDQTEEQMEAQLVKIKEICDGRVRYSVRMDGIAIRFTEEECMEKMSAWNRAAKKVFPGDK